MSLSTTSSHCEGKDEHHNLGSSVHRRRDEVVVLDEELWAILSKVELCKVCDEEESRHGTVDTHEEVSHKPQNDGRVQISPSLLSSPLVHQVGWDRDEESDQEGQRNPLVLGSDTEHLGRNAPGYSQGVELLNVLSGPDISALDARQDWCLVLNNADLNETEVSTPVPRSNWKAIFLPSSPS